MISPTRSLHQSAAQASVAALLTLACMAAGCYAPQQSQADTRGAAPPVPLAETIAGVVLEGGSRRVALGRGLSEQYRWKGFAEAFLAGSPASD